VELRIEKVQRQLWGRKSERMASGEDQQELLFSDPTPMETAHAPAARGLRGEGKARVPNGPKPLDPLLAREMPLSTLAQLCRARHNYVSADSHRLPFCASAPNCCSTSVYNPP
jgi:hypothetical protein